VHLRLVVFTVRFVPSNSCTCGYDAMHCRRSLVSLSDMLEAVVFLKDLQSRGLVLEVSRGVWLRAPAAAPEG